MPAPPPRLGPAAAGPPSSGRRLGRALALAAAALLGAGLVVVTQAPADLAGAALRHWTQGRVDLGDASGTLWTGQADLILASGDGSGATRLPGRLAWHLAAGPLLLGNLDLTLRDAALLDQPFVLDLPRSGAATFAPNRLRLPAGVLQGLGAPWNTIQPGGELQLEWDTLHLDGGALRGALRAEWIGASSRLSPVVPFGHYRLLADGIYAGAALSLETVSGPMEMTGNGTIASGNQLRFRGTARVLAGTDTATATQLSGLISLLGRRDGDGALLNFGT